MSLQPVSGNPFDLLPYELLCKVFNSLDLKSLLIASEVCKHWNSVIDNSSEVWKNRCPVGLTPPMGKKWKSWFAGFFSGLVFKQAYTTTTELLDGERQVFWSIVAPIDSPFQARHVAELKPSNELTGNEWMQFGGTTVPFSARLWTFGTSLIYLETSSKSLCSLSPIDGSLVAQEEISFGEKTPLCVCQDAENLLYFGTSEGAILTYALQEGWRSVLTLGPLEGERITGLFVDEHQVIALSQKGMCTSLVLMDRLTEEWFSLDVGKTIYYHVKLIVNDSYVFLTKMANWFQIGGILRVDRYTLEMRSYDIQAFVRAVQNTTLFLSSGPKVTLIDHRDGKEIRTLTFPHEVHSVAVRGPQMFVGSGGTLHTVTWE